MSNNWKCGKRESLYFFGVTLHSCSSGGWTELSGWIMRYLIHMNRKKSLMLMIQFKGWILKCTGIYCLLWFWFYFAMKNQRFQNQSTHKELERKRLSWKLIILSIFMGLISVLRQFLKGALKIFPTSSLLITYHK